MASSVSVALLCAMCLILMQNQVYSKPAAQEPQHSGETTPAVPAIQKSEETQPNPSHQPTGTQSSQTETEPEREEKEVKKENPVTPAAASGEAKPSAQSAGEKKDNKNASAVSVANFGLLILGASLLLRL